MSDAASFDRRKFLAASTTAVAASLAGSQANGAVQLEDPLACADALLLGKDHSFSKLFYDPQRDQRLLGSFSLATNDDNVDLMKKIFSKIAFATSVGENSGRPGDTFLVLENPGLFFDPKFDIGKVVDARILATMVDPLPNANWIYQQSSRSTSDIYAMTLRDKELPLHTLSEAQKEKRREAMKTVRNTERAYFEKAEIFWDANDEYLSAMEEARNRGLALNPRYEFRKNQAWSVWLTKGHKLLWENAVATIYNLDALDPNRTWYELQQLLDQNRRLDGATPFFTTDLTPKYSEIVDPQSQRWKKFVFGKADWENQRYHSHVSASGGGSGGWGLWRVSAGASYEEDKGFEKSFASDISIEMEMQRVKINREWLRPFIYQTRAWRWYKGSLGSGSPISDGVAITPTTQPAGWMPLLPVALLACRNVKISAKINQREYEYFSSRLTANASVGWGPFSIGGNYSRSESSSHEKGTITANGIESPAPQIIGWYCDMLPTSPNPDPTLTWPNAKPLPDYDAAYMSKYRGFRSRTDVTNIEESAQAFITTSKN